MKLGRPRADRDYFGRSTTDAPPDLASAIRLDWILDVKTELNVPMGGKHPPKAAVRRP